MPCKLLFANLAPSATKGKLLDVLSGEHPMTPKMTMKEHIKAGGTGSNWNRYFSLVIITDREKQELDYLLNDVIEIPNSDPVDYQEKYYFIEPVQGSVHFNALLNQGEIEITFSEFEQYIKARK